MPQLLKVYWLRTRIIIHKVNLEKPAEVSVEPNLQGFVLQMCKICGYVMKKLKLIIILIFLLVPFILAQENPYPNELKGYEFFGMGKLKDLQLGVSTKEDIAKNLGGNCDDSCDYDEDWSIKFLYFGKLSRTVNGKPVTYNAAPAYLGKLFSVTLRPKTTISFSEKVFSLPFARSLGGTYAHGKDFVNNTFYDVYTDDFGMSYTLFNNVYTTVNNVYTTDKNPPKRKKGDLLSIEYRIPFIRQKQMFIEQK